MEDLVVLVNEQDISIGTMEKLEAHEKGLLHRAFSVFIFDDNDRLLLQRRALTKYHSPGLWTNTCCSHPRPKEKVLEASHRRLKEEMGFDSNITQVDSFIYKTEFDNGLTEHEYDHILIGKSNTLPIINKNEVHEYKYLSINEIKIEINSKPDNFTFWFRLAFSKIDFQKHLEEYQVN